jgi:hypothetical protein
VKLFVNSPNLDFEYAAICTFMFFSPSSTAEGKVASAVINLTPNDLLEEAKPIILDTIKFGRVDTITVRDIGSCFD